MNIQKAAEKMTIAQSTLYFRIGAAIENASTAGWFRISTEKAHQMSLKICEAVEYKSLAAAKREMKRQNIPFSLLG